MTKISSIMVGDKVTINVEIEPQDKYRYWCIVVCSMSSYDGGFMIPTIARVLEYIYKVDTFCGKDSQTIKREYLMPGQYLAILGTSSSEIRSDDIIDTINQTGTESGPIITKFEITGHAITDKDIKSAMEILSCMADIHNGNKKKGEKVFDNMMLEPIFSTIVEFLNHIVDKRDISLYTDVVKNRINIQGPILKEGKYFWPIIQQGKYVEYHD
jgi:hypothetical protein